MLNAFRHHRVLRQKFSSRLFWFRLCSTPFGITGCYANLRAVHPGRHSCAQRLSASQGATHSPRTNPVTWYLMCSTPFGITGCYAQAHISQPNVSYRAQRLSASQGATHRPGAVSLSKRQSVLNAFRHHRVLRTTRTHFSYRSDTVLNAFRHHRVLRRATRPTVLSFPKCSTPFGITGCYAVGRRHGAPDPLMCSTPFGITGCYATYSASCSLLGGVLNAFRHHRVLRAELKMLQNIQSVCSTPFGITGCYARAARD